MNEMKATALESPFDCVLSQAQLLQLAPGKHPMLLVCPVGNSLIISTRLQ